MNTINFMSLLNGGSQIFLLLFFLLLARQNIWAWVAGGLSALMGHGSSILIALKYSNITSVSSSAYYWLIVYLLLCLYGAWVWYQNGHRFFHQPKEQYYPISSLLKEPYSKQKYMVLGIVLSVLLLISILTKQGIFSYLYIIVYSLAFVLIADKKVEAWILLIISVVLLKLSIMWQLNALSHNTGDAVKILSALQSIKNGEVWSKLIIFIYGFIYWKSKLNKEEEIEYTPLFSLLKTGLLSLIYIVLAFVTPFLLTYLACMGSTGCSGIPAGLFLMLFYFVALIIAAIILFVKKEHFKQWQLFFVANGLFGITVLQLILGAWK